MEKKQSSIYIISAVHFIIGGFLLPIIFSIILTAIPVVIILAGFPKESIFALSNALSANTTFAIAYKVFLVWLSVFISTKYVQKKYIINDKKKIALWSTLYQIPVQIGALSYIAINNLARNQFGVWLGIQIFLSFLSLVIFIYYTFFYLHDEQEIQSVKKKLSKTNILIIATIFIWFGGRLIYSIYTDLFHENPATQSKVQEAYQKQLELGIKNNQQTNNSTNYIQSGNANDSVPARNPEPSVSASDITGGAQVYDVGTEENLLSISTQLNAYFAANNTYKGFTFDDAKTNLVQNEYCRAWTIFSVSSDGQNFILYRPLCSDYKKVFCIEKGMNAVSTSDTINVNKTYHCK